MRNGEDARLPDYKERGTERWCIAHTWLNVYREMLYQICLDYSGLPDFRTLTLSDITFFYDGLRPTLKAHTKPQKQS